MVTLSEYDKRADGLVPIERVRNVCFVKKPKEMFITLMAGDRVAFKGECEASKYYLRAVEIFRTVYREGMSDFEFVRALNRYIAENISYDHQVVAKRSLTKEDMDSFEMDGPLFKGKGVCAAMSKFFSLMCALAGIKTVLVTGSLKESKRDVRHAWNKVYLKRAGDTEKGWWNIDVTNNRPSLVSEGRYFLISDSMIKRTHFFIEYPEGFEYNSVNRAVTGTADYPKSPD